MTNLFLRFGETIVSQVKAASNSYYALFLMKVTYNTFLRINSPKTAWIAARSLVSGLNALLRID